jgi:isopenicillin-N epimerase
MQRRHFLRATATAALLSPNHLSIARAASVATVGRNANEMARDEDFWREIQQAFTVDRSLINLNNGGVSPSPRVVQDSMRRQLEFSNMAPAINMWRVLEPEIEAVRTRLAASFGCDPEEMAITRNASESLETCQLGLDLKRGDEVLTTDQDYGRMLTTWRQRERRDGIVLKTVSFSVPPASPDVLFDLFEKNITPKTKVIHLCHITNLSGQIFPVKRICQMAKSRGIETIVDGAHAYAHFPFTHADLDCDYYGTSLHKWLFAPHGTGFLYVRKSKIEKLWPMMPAPAEMDKDIRKFEEIGTHPAANHNAIADALTFNEGIGPERKAARLRYLKSIWVDRLGAMPGAKVLTSPDPAQSCGIGCLSISGKDPGALSDLLLSKYQILVTPIRHKDVNGLRITPSVYTTVAEVNRFCDVMEKVVKS